MQKFTYKEFNKKYSDDNACLEAIFNARYGAKKCPKCKHKSKFHKLSKRKCYSCQNCGYNIFPLADTIFHKSSTSLKDWFFAIYLFATSKNGVSAKELQRQLGCTYKTAWRIGKQIRLLFSQNNIQLFDVVEADETYIGGKKGGKRGRGAGNKTAVFGIVQRKGSIKVKVVKNVKSKTLLPIIKENVKNGARFISDEFPSYSKVGKNGYNHNYIKHAVKEYVRGDIHTNNIEGFWSQLKRSIDGTHHAVSPKYLQSYVDEFSYRYNQRNASSPLFYLFLEEVLKRA
ncbi:MAG: IS1595 family transposase [Candidatus Paceibacterota bacterium]